MSDYNPNHPAAGGAQSWGQSSPQVPSQNVQATMSEMTSQLQTVIDAAERAAEAIRFDAEEQARQHLAEAQRKADRLTAERVGLISDLTDDLIRHASTVRDHSEQMIRALEDAISSVTGKLEQPGLTDPISGYEPYSPPAPEPVPAQAYEPPSPPAYEPPAPYSPPAPSSEPSAFPPPVQPPAASAPVPPPAAPSYVAPPPSSPPVLPDHPPVASEDALLHATRLAVAGENRETIAAALRDQFGVADPDPIVSRVLGES